MGLRVLEPGLYSLLVGRPRTGSRHLGVPVGGPADFGACALGNALVGNPPDALAIEITLLGPTLQATAPIAGVIFGAPFQLSGSREVGRIFNLAERDVLKIGGTAHGCRAYLCVPGGFAGKEILKSESSLEPVRNHELLGCGASSLKPRWGVNPFESSPGVPPVLGSPGVPPVGLDWREVTSDSQANRRDAGATRDRRDAGPTRDRRDAGPTQLLRVLPGPQRSWFPDSHFFEQGYTVAAASNRMGLRLQGIPLVRPPRELASEPVAPGAVQITNDGLPVILGVDGQTIGGYPKIAHIIRADLDRLGQLRPGNSVRFVEVTPVEAEAAHIRQRADLRKTIAFWRMGSELG